MRQSEKVARLVCSLSLLPYVAPLFFLAEKGAMLFCAEVFNPDAKDPAYPPL